MFCRMVVDLDAHKPAAVRISPYNFFLLHKHKVHTSHQVEETRYERRNMSVQFLGQTDWPKPDYVASTLSAGIKA